jgi:hypothetical protein
MSDELNTIADLIVAKGNEIRDLKSSKADKSVITQHVEQLNALKEK